ncbi:MAG TPA: hypothetical protein VMM12_18570 [Longimicrobiales bacterium]|nr:hypothetical protein [Longimicrobiales bacterium]
MDDLKTELARAEALARAAGAAAMRHYGTASATEKADASPVTEADRASNRVILAGLRARSPTTPGALSPGRAGGRATAGAFHTAMRRSIDRDG